jgi:carbamoyl-phosphate synthase large subunit
VNTPSGPTSREDEISIRSEAVARKIPLVTTESGARATAAGIGFMKGRDWAVNAIQDFK